MAEKYLFYEEAQEKYGSKNLLKPRPEYSYETTSNGVFFSRNKDKGTVLANGTASSNSSVIVNYFRFEVGTTYILTGCPEGGSASTYALHIDNGDIYDYGEGVEYTHNSPDAFIPIRIRVYSGYRASNLIFKPMIRIKGTSDNFVPYAPTNRQIYESIGVLKSGRTNPYQSGAKNNSQYCFRDITEYYKDGSLWDRIKSSNDFDYFDGLYPGCYFDIDTTITAPESTSTGTNRILIAGLQMLNPYQLGSKTTPHLVCCPLTHFGMAKMNDGNTTEGGYAGSKMHNDILGPVVSEGKADGTINEQLYAVFGEHLLTTKERLTKTVTTTAYNRLGTATGASTAADWYDCQSVLFSEMEVYGGTVFSSSGYDTGNAKHQMPAFMYDEELMLPWKVYYWLKDVVNSSYFSLAYGNDGFAHYNGASIAYYVRPRFIIS